MFNVGFVSSLQGSFGLISEQREKIDHLET
jgi:hypothetical protein